MKIIEVHEDDSNQRIDRYLKKLFPSASPGFIQKILRTDKVKVGDKRVKTGDHRLFGGDTIKLYLSDDVLSEISRVNNVNTIVNDVKDMQKFSEAILYEDGDILCINKMPGINVHPGDHKTKEVSLIQLAEDYIRDTSSMVGNLRNFEKPFISLVHRIDRDTSGVLLFAKNRLSLNNLLDQLQDHSFEKTYIAVCSGSIDKRTQTISAPLLRREVDAGAKVIVSEQGQKAITHVSVLKKTEEFTLIEARIETGRMHQIRVHLAHIGHPIIGDKNYGISSVNRAAYAKYGIVRQLLHASSLTIMHPKTKTSLTFKAPTPVDIARLFPI